MTAADVVVVNSIGDGMNLVARETAVVSERDCVLILSSRAGAADELGAAALLVDPSDTAQLTRALSVALRMDARERRKRADQLRDHRRRPAAAALAGSAVAGSARRAGFAGRHAQDACGPGCIAGYAPHHAVSSSSASASGAVTGIRQTNPSHTYAAGPPSMVGRSASSGTASIAS